MNSHSYLRAFLAGVFLPTLILPVLLTAYIVGRVVLKMPIPIEQALIFPMAIVPSAFGLWNMLWLGSHRRTRLPIGVHGAILPYLILPSGAAAATGFGVLAFGAQGVVWFHIVHVPYALIAPGFLAVVIGYYLIWKYIVGGLNGALGIA